MSSAKLREPQQNDSIKILEAVRTLSTVPDLVQELQDELQRQNHSIELLKSGQKQAQQKQEELIQQNFALQAQISNLSEQVEKLIQQGGRANPTPPQTWANVARRGHTLEPPNLPKQAKPNPTTLRLFTSLEPTGSEEVNDSFTRYMPTEKATTMITQALQKYSPTVDAQLLGVGSTKTGYLLRFRNETSMELAKKNSDWTKDLGQRSRVVTPRFGVVAHRTPTAEVDMDEKEESIEKIMRENELASKGSCIEEIAWLKKKDLPLGQSASLGIWFSSAEAAEQAVAQGLVFGQRFVPTIEHYQSRRKRCFRCQGIGHIAWNCKEKERCGNCCGEHSRRDCTATTLRCADCGESHPTDSASCNSTPGSSRLQ